MSPGTTDQGVEPTSKKDGPGPNPIVLFLGFALLGAAFALVLFGGNLFGGASEGGSEDVSGSATSAQSILDQVSELPAVDVDAVGNPYAGSADGLLEVGDLAYNFTLNDFDGNPVSLADFGGRPVIVNFWATWCAPCRIEMPELQAAYDSHQDDGLVILALDQDEPVDVAREFFYEEMGLTFTPLLDEKSAISTAYGSFSVLPSTFFIDPDGAVSAIHRGPMTLGQIDGYLADMIPDSG